MDDICKPMRNMCDNHIKVKKPVGTSIGHTYTDYYLCYLQISVNGQLPILIQRLVARHCDMMKLLYVPGMLSIVECVGMCVCGLIMERAAINGS